MGLSWGLGHQRLLAREREQAATGFMQVLTNKTAEWVGTTFGSGAQSALFSNVGGAVGADGVVSAVTLRWVALRARF